MNKKLSKQIKKIAQEIVLKQPEVFDNPRFYVKDYVDKKGKKYRLTNLFNPVKNLEKKILDRYEKLSEEIKALPITNIVASFMDDIISEYWEALK